MTEQTRRTRERHIPWPVSIEVIEQHLVWVNATSQKAAIRAVTRDPGAWLKKSAPPLHHVILVRQPDDNDIETSLADRDKE